MLSKTELPECPVATAVNLIGNKWKPLIIRDLMNGTQRYKYLQYGIKGISPKVLTENLKQLEDDGIVKREVYAEVPLRVEYSLTPLGEQMRPVILALADWGNKYKKSYQQKNNATYRLSFSMQLHDS